MRIQISRRVISIGLTVRMLVVSMPMALSADKMIMEDDSYIIIKHMDTVIWNFRINRNTWQGTKKCQKTDMKTGMRFTPYDGKGVVQRAGKAEKTVEERIIVFFGKEEYRYGLSEEAVQKSYTRGYFENVLSILSFLEKVLAKNSVPYVYFL